MMLQHFMNSSHCNRQKSVLFKNCCQFLRLRVHSVITVCFSLRYNFADVVIIYYTGYSFDSPQKYM